MSMVRPINLLIRTGERILIAACIRARLLVTTGLAKMSSRLLGPSLGVCPYMKEPVLVLLNSVYIARGELFLDFDSVVNNANNLANVVPSIHQ